MRFDLRYRHTSACRHHLRRPASWSWWAFPPWPQTQELGRLDDKALAEALCCRHVPRPPTNTPCSSGRRWNASIYEKLKLMNICIAQPKKLSTSTNVLRHSPVLVYPILPPVLAEKCHSLRWQRDTFLGIELRIQDQAGSDFSWSQLKILMNGFFMGTYVVMGALLRAAMKATRKWILNKQSYGTIRQMWKIEALEG